MSLRIPARPGQTWVERTNAITAAEIGETPAEPRKRIVTQLEAAADGGVDVTFTDGEQAWRTTFHGWLRWIELTGAELAA